MEDKDKEALTRVKQLSQALQNGWLNRPNGAELLSLREALETVGDKETEEEELPARLVALAEFLQHSSKVPTATPDHPELLKMQADFLRRHGLPNDFKPLDPQTERARAYLKKFSKPQQPRKITERQLKEWAWEIADEKVQASGGEQFDFDVRNKYLFADLLYYFAGDPKSRYELKKGVALFGDVGAGKTILFQIFSTLLARHFPESPRRFKIKKCRVIAQEYNDAAKDPKVRETEIIEKYAKGNICFDDTGDEEEVLKIYGNNIPLIDTILKERYDRFVQGSGELTHITTNKDIEGLYEKYGDRTGDRLGQMMSFQGVSGESRRPK